MANIRDLNTRNYLRNLSQCEKAFFITPWAGVIIKNCDISGNMIHYCTTQSYIQSKIPLWLFLSLKLFRDDQGIYGAFVCSTCPSMSSVAMLTLDQRREDIENILCLHSVAAAELTGDWRDFWGLPAIDNETLSHKFQVGLDVEVKELMEKDLFLAAVQNGGVVHLIFTLSKKTQPHFVQSVQDKNVNTISNSKVSKMSKIILMIRMRIFQTIVMIL